MRGTIMVDFDNNDSIFDEYHVSFDEKNTTRITD